MYIKSLRCKEGRDESQIVILNQYISYFLKKLKVDGKKICLKHYDNVVYYFLLHKYDKLAKIITNIFHIHVKLFTGFLAIEFSDY